MDLLSSVAVAIGLNAGGRYVRIRFTRRGVQVSARRAGCAIAIDLDPILARVRARHEERAMAAKQTTPTQPTTTPAPTDTEHHDDVADRLRTTIALLTVYAQAMAAFEPGGHDRELASDAWRGVEGLLLQAR